MKKIIKKILNEGKFTRYAHQQLSDANSKTARLHGVDPDDWYLGTQIYYHHQLNRKNASCIFIGSPDYEILANKLFVISPDFWKREDKGYQTYCDIINQYYDLDNFSTGTDDISENAFLDRYVNLVTLDSELDVENYLLEPDEYTSIFGFEYNDWDEDDEIGTYWSDMVETIVDVFPTNNRAGALVSLHNWVENKVRTNQYRDV